MSRTLGPLLPAFARPQSRVAIRRADSYSADLASLLFETISQLGISVAGKRVLLKPNMVGLDEKGVTNTHPAVIGAARECFLRLGAKHVAVGDGPAGERDTEAIVNAMRLRDYVGPLDRCFVDLNTDNVSAVPLRSRASRLKELFLPETLLSADFVVTMPKMKTHRWTGVSLGLKNMFGVVPGCCYGWPKNILHWAGIAPAVLDINATVRPDFAIVDGIIAMEGNGPLNGDAKNCGVLVFGDDVVAVDATCARVMGVAPERLDYMRQAGTLLGHVEERNILQIGDTVQSVCAPFQLPPGFERLYESANGAHFRIVGR